MRRMTQWVLGGLLGSLLCGGMAEARVIHVPVDYRTIQAAVNAASAGDTIKVFPGTYREIVTLKSGVQLHALETVNTDGSSGVVVIDAQGLACVAGAPCNPTYAIGLPAGSTGIEVVGFRLITPGSTVSTGILVRGIGHRIEHNRVQGYGESGILVDGATNCTLVGNRVRGYIDLGVGIELKNSNAIKLVNNIAEGNSYGITISGGARDKVVGNVISADGYLYTKGMLIDQHPNALLANNTIFASDAANLQTVGLYLYSSPGLMIYNCIIMGAPRPNQQAYGIVSQGGSSASVWYSDVVGQTRPIVGSGITINPGVTFADPLLIDPYGSSPDFRLQAASPARNRGTGQDRDGTQADMGAYGGVW